MSRMRFKDKVVVVSGSSQGIGKAIAQEFIKNGAFVTINGRNKEKLDLTVKELNAPNGRVLSCVADIRIESEAKEIIDRTIEQFGRLDILINNAALSMRGDFSKLSPSVFKKVFETNVLGVSNLSIPAMPYLKKSKGSLVFISSLAGIRGLPGMSAYSSSKMALRGIAESIRVEESESGIHVGLIQVSATEIEKSKKIISPDGDLVPMVLDPEVNAYSTRRVAKIVLRNIKKKEFITTISKLGKLNAFLKSTMPGLGEKILIYAKQRFHSKVDNKVDLKRIKASS